MVLPSKQEQVPRQRQVPTSEQTHTELHLRHSAPAPLEAEQQGR